MPAERWHFSLGAPIGRIKKSHQVDDSSVPPRGRIPNHIFPKIRGKYSAKGLTVRKLMEN
jgi:hypothetical protein